MNRLIPCMMVTLMLTVGAIHAQDARSILIVTPGRASLSPGFGTGARISDIVAASDAFRAAGWQIAFATPEGGIPAFEPGSVDTTLASHNTFLRGDGGRALSTSPSLSVVDGSRFRAVLFVGGHAALLDFVEEPHAARIAMQVWNTGGVVAAVGHGVAGLLGARKADSTSFLSWLRLTATTDEEEERSGRMEDLPYRLETALRRNGAVFFKDNIEHANVVADDRVITAQNSRSLPQLCDAVLLRLRQIDEAAAAAAPKPVPAPGTKKPKRTPR